jgi:hypothetical protein
MESSARKTSHQTWEFIHHAGIPPVAFMDDYPAGCRSTFYRNPVQYNEGDLLVCSVISDHMHRYVPVFYERYIMPCIAECILDRRRDPELLQGMSTVVRAYPDAEYNFIVIPGGFRFCVECVAMVDGYPFRFVGLVDLWSITEI